MDLPPEIGAILAAFAPRFSDRLWVKAQLLAVGALLATGDRTVWAVLRVMGLSRERPFINSHRVLNREAWSCRAAGQVRLGLIVAVLPRDWPISWPPRTPASGARAAASRPRAATAIPSARCASTS